MELEKLLQRQGLRMTAPRKYIARLLSRYPLTAEELYEQLKKQNHEVDLASVYRTLLLFVKLHVAEEVTFGDGKKRYEAVSSEDHHHHAICNRCGRIEDIVMDEHKLLSDIAKRTSFVVTRHSLEFFGQCAACQ